VTRSLARGVTRSVLAGAALLAAVAARAHLRELEYQRALARARRQPIGPDELEELERAWSSFAHGPVEPACTCAGVERAPGDAHALLCPAYADTL
jgi:hypothetical protein